MLSGYEIALDGDLLRILESLYEQVTLRKELKHTYEDTMEEIKNLVAQMPEEERQRYLIESLWLNFVTYENEMLEEYVQHLGAKAAKRRDRK